MPKSGAGEGKRDALRLRDSENVLLRYFEELQKETRDDAMRGMI